MVTHALLPLNARAEPNFPDGVQVAPPSVPVFPWPDESRVWTPRPSLKPYAATSPETVDDVFETATLTVAVVRKPAASRATAESVCTPLDVVDESHVKVSCPTERSAPSGF